MSKKLIYGIGYNSQRKYLATKNRKPTEAYNKWHQMMQRCYSKKHQEKNPTYIGCTVDHHWHDFQNFAEWFESKKNGDADYQIDKDLLVSNNKVYSRENCCLVPHEINSLLLGNKSRRGLYPQGVYFHKASGKYKAQLSASPKKIHLGYFNCPYKAHEKYRLAKERHVKNKALEWANRIDWGVFVALMNWELET